ncbi:NAD(P)-binding protein [Clavulina sp. PMI_390]|nr:NAD(P)-binding protein [Clavulina sp. PMI_390]
MSAHHSKAHSSAVRYKVAVITGGGTGIGYQVARAYAEAGADIALFYNSSAEAIEKAAGLEKEFGIKAKAYKVPITDSTIVTDSINQVEKDFGHLDIFVANAGMTGGGAVIADDYTDERWHKVVDVNYSSVFYCARAAGRIFKKQGSGNFIVTSSMSAHIVNRPITQAVYNGSKAGLTHFARSLAFEWKDFARVNVVSPGFFDTGMGAAPDVLDAAYDMAVLGRQGDPRELKGIYLYLASDASTFTTGADFIVDGGYTLP